MTTTHPAPPDFVDPLDLVEPARFAEQHVSGLNASSDKVL